jgi:two-component system, chemotaxis family, chemotaxis protein CheY
MKILVIDDDHLVRYTVSRILKKSGHDVVTAADGARGIEVLGMEHPDVVITDIIMPEQEGFQTIVKIRRDHPGIKIIAISGGLRREQGNLDVLSMAEGLGADSVIAKPFEPEELLAELAKLDFRAPMPT